MVKVLGQPEKFYLTHNNLQTITKLNANHVISLIIYNYLVFLEKHF